MNNGFLTAIRTEFYVICRGTGLWLLISLPALAVLVRLTLVKLTTISTALQNSDGESANALSGYGFMVDGMSTGLMLLYLIFVAYAAYVFAIDRDSGVLRHLIIRRVSRRALIAAKFVILSGLAFTSAAIVIAVAIFSSSFFWELGPVVEDNYELIGVAEIHQEIYLGLKLALLSLPACLSLGLLISVISGSATQAVSIAIGVSLVFDVFKNVFGDLANYFYATFQPSLIDQSYLKDVAQIVRGFSDVLIDERVYQLNLWLPLPQALLFFVLTLFIVSRRQL
ncbi:ABC transporter permease [Aurantivibrio infirmus]